MGQYLAVETEEENNCSWGKEGGRGGGDWYMCSKAEERTSIESKKGGERGEGEGRGGQHGS